MDNKIQNIDERLLAISKYVRKDSIVADIGCDHGKLSVYLAQNNIAKKVIATDVAQLPLQKAKELVSKYNLQNKIECRLGDGLATLQKGEVSDIIIAGMSGVTIHKIILAVDFSKDENLHFILVPASKPEVLRKNLYLSGFKIIKEHIIAAKDRVYPVMLVEYANNIQDKDDYFCLMGKTLETKSNANKLYIEKKVRHLTKQLEKNSDNSQTKLLLEKLKDDLATLNFKEV